MGPRNWVRLMVFAGLFAALVEFLRFVDYVKTGANAGAVLPEAADAFLPLAGIAAIKVWLATGWLDSMHPAAVVIVIATLVTAFLFRRALCSWLCPLGALAEYLAKAGRRLLGANVALPTALDRGLIAVKYAGTFALLWWLLSTPTDDLLTFMTTPFYAVAEMKLFSVYSEISLVGTLVVLILLGLSMLVKSFWCRYLCPYGALQGLLGVLSPMTISKDDSGCTGCSRCSAVCPNAVDVASAEGAVTTAECMGCTNCVTACPRQGVLELRLLGRWRIEPSVFGLAFVAVFAVLIVGAVVSGRWTSSLPADTYREIYEVAPGTTSPWGEGVRSGAPAPGATNSGGIVR